MSTNSESEYQVPQPCEWARTEIEAFARDIAASLKYEPTDAIEPVIEKLGGQIVYTDLSKMPDSSKSLVGWIQVERKGDFRVLLSGETNRERDRFTLAHELGHYVLHYLVPVAKSKKEFRLRANLAEQLAKDKATGVLAEDEANWFAFEFLMPRGKFTQSFNDCGGDIGMIAVVFRVPRWIAEIRAKSLGLHSSNRAKDI